MSTAPMSRRFSPARRNSTANNQSNSVKEPTEQAGYKKASPLFRFHRSAEPSGSEPPPNVRTPSFQRRRTKFSGIVTRERIPQLAADTQPGCKRLAPFFATTRDHSRHVCGVLSVTRLCLNSAGLTHTIAAGQPLSRTAPILSICSRT